MNKDTLLFIGLDTHKEFTEVAYINDERGSMNQHYGKIQTTKPALIKLVRLLTSKFPKATLNHLRGQV